MRDEPGEKLLGGDLHIVDGDLATVSFGFEEAVDGRTRRLRFPRSATSYGGQLDAFVTAVLGDGPVLTPPADSVANMAVVDAVYQAAGLEPRPSQLQAGD